MTFSGSYMGGVYGDFGGIIGAVLVGLGLLEFVIAWGYLTRKPWSRIVGLVFAGIGIFEGVSSLPTGLITIAIDAVVIYYLTRPHIVDWFAGKSLEPAQPPPPAPPTI